MGALTIIKAWTNVLNGLTTNEHRRRADICKVCPHAKKRKILDLINDELRETKGMICALCGCPLSAKIRSDEMCYRWQQPTK
jgi:hypothetical protein